jgi:hypothetical protein
MWREIQGVNSLSDNDNSNIQDRTAAQYTSAKGGCSRIGLVQKEKLVRGPARGGLIDIESWV